MGKRIKTYGHNKEKKRKSKGLCTLLIEPFDDRMMQILSVAAIVSLICGYIQDGFHGLIEGVSIIISILIILVVTAGNNYVKEKQFQELQ